MNKFVAQSLVVAAGALAGLYASTLGDKAVGWAIWASYAVVLLAVSGSIVRWVRGEIDAFDPQGLLSVFCVHFFGVTPIYQYASGSYPYLPWDTITDGWVTNWFVCNAAAVVVLFFLISKSRIFDAHQQVQHVESPSEGSSRAIQTAQSVRQFAIMLLMAALVLKGLVLAKFGGLGGMMAAYQERLEMGVTQYNPLAGLGPVVYLSDAAPVVAAIVLVISRAVISPRSGSAWGAWLLVIGIPVSFVYVGLIGSRSNTVYTVFVLLCYSSMFWSRLRAVKLILGGLVMVVFMNGYLAYKFGGIEAVFNEDARKAAFAVKQLENPLEFLLVRDFGRMDVQVIAMREMFDEGYPPSLGRSYVGGLFSIVPSALYPGRPESFTLEKTEIIFPGATLDGEKSTTLVFGGAGEAWVNWKWLAPLLVVPYGLIVGFCVWRFRAGASGEWDKLLCPIYSLIPIALLVYDSNSMLYFLAQFAICPLLISLKVKRANLPAG